MGWGAASMPPHGPAIGEDTAPDSLLAALLKAFLSLGLPWEADRTRCTMRSDHPDWSLPAPRRGTLRGMDAA
ncbi:hypothetical protein [Xanthomonas hortorum]|uniref:hypothetical protein n=1 Tax=Xanthomonas hortorum TaxID=56454 RepID=UPI0011123576